MHNSKVHWLKRHWNYTMLIEDCNEYSILNKVQDGYEKTKHLVHWSKNKTQGVRNYKKSVHEKQKNIQYTN